MKRIHSAADAAALRNKSFATDTTFVLFFLALEFGRSTVSFAFDGFLLGLSLVALLILPFFFFSDEAGRPEFGRWVLGRSLVVMFAAGLGIVFNRVVGVVIPEAFRFLPMTLLIATASMSCYVQFYSLMRLRPAK